MTDLRLEDLDGMYLITAVFLGVPVPLDDPDPGQEGDVHPVLGALRRETLSSARRHLKLRES